MSSPVTWQLLEHVRDALKLITVARGYSTDLGLGVVALEAAQLPEEGVPSTLIIGSEIPVNEEASTRTTTKSEMDIVIEFAVPFDNSDAQLVAHRARSDVMRALVPLRKHIKERPLCVTSFAITGSRIGQPEDGASVVIAQVTARAGLIESQTPAN